MIPERYPKKRPKAILFDWDNTLVDTWRVAFDSLNIALKSLGRRPLTLKEFWGNPHHSLRDASAQLFGEHAEEGERVFYENIESLHLKEIKALEGAEPLLEGLKSQGMYMGVVSNKHGNFLRKEVSHLGWNSHFQHVVGARDLEEDKPSSLPVKVALEKSSVSAGHEVWFVGDSIVDVLCAKASGCIPVVVGEGTASQQEDIIHVKDCHGLANLLAKL